MVTKVVGGAEGGGFKATEKGTLTATNGTKHQISGEGTWQSSPTKNFATNFFSTVVAHGATFLQSVYEKATELRKKEEPYSTEAPKKIEAMSEGKWLKKASEDGDTKTLDLLYRRQQASLRTVETTNELNGLLAYDNVHLITKCGNAHVLIPTRHKHGFDQYIDAKEGDVLYLDISDLHEDSRRIYNLPLDQDYIELSPTTDNLALGYKI